MPNKNKTQTTTPTSNPVASPPNAAAPTTSNIIPTLGAIISQIVASLVLMVGFTSLTTLARRRIVKLRKGAATLIDNMITLAEQFPAQMPAQIDTVKMRAQLAQYVQVQLLTLTLQAATRQAEDELLSEGQWLWQQTMLIYGVAKLMVKSNLAIEPQVDAMTAFLAQGKRAKPDSTGGSTTGTTTSNGSNTSTPATPTGSGAPSVPLYGPGGNGVPVGSVPPTNGK